MNETNRSKYKKRAVAVAVASCLSLAPWLAEAAGLGKLTVLSALGQPLRAELDLGASKEELTGMTARLAPQEAFRQAGIDFASTLLDLHFSVEKRPGGQSIVKVTSGRPINEPFLDFLVELNWPTGRLVREYTFLLDPPEIAAKQAARMAVDAKVIDTVQGGGAGGMERSAAPRTAQRPVGVPKLASETRKADGETTRVVQPGDTLRKIAGETQYEGVSLEQMLVGLFRKNPDAFVGNNINRLKAGAILGIPEKAAVESVSEAEAKKVYVTQAADWNAYRHKLAGATAAAPAREEAGAQASSGKITAKVEEKVAPAEQSKDKVRVSPTEMGGKGGVAKAAADAEIERIAKDKALKEAQERLAILEKNVAELQKLVELKNQKLAELQAQAAPRKEEAKPAEAAKPVEQAKPVELPKAAEPAKPVEPPVPEVPKPAEPAAVEPPKPVEEPKPPVEPPKPVPPEPVKKPAPPPAPLPEPGLLDSLLEDPLPLVGGVAALALLGGYFVVRRRRRPGEALTTTAIPGPSSLGPNSVFRMTGGQSVDTGNTPPQTGDFSQTGPGTIDTDEVDPVAEADVYMAYGRDTQAEEILLEAMQKDPQRTAIHAKLLEIYANRRSVKQFETLAGELYSQTGGVGPDWEKAAALGAGLDPNNPLYSSSAKAEPAFDADATMVASSVDLASATLAMPAGGMAKLVESGALASAAEAIQDYAHDTQVLPEPAAAETETAGEAPIEEAPADLMSLDFDLGIPEATASGTTEPEVEPLSETMVVSHADDALDFDLGANVATQVQQAEPIGELHVAEDDVGDFELAAADLTKAAAEEPDFSLEGTMLTPPSAQEVGVETFVGGETPREPTVEDVPVEADRLVDFELDLDAPAVQTSINPVMSDVGTETLVVSHAPDSPALSETVISPAVSQADALEFDVNLTDSVFLGQPMMTPEFDIGSINLDLSAQPQIEATAPEPEPQPAPVALAEPEPAPTNDGNRDAHWEEVNTKLDLAKAYEEMGDLEGARELLQEVAGEGSPDLVEQARTILGRIGE